jgi:peptidoglycan L-alanyl-D-glutamate endopeptidase CwlK
MINSRNINDLRPDVAANCQALLDACKAAGFNAGLSATYRDQEYQTKLFKESNAPALVSFHGARLAFDIYENLNGITSYRDVFFSFAAPLAKKMGFTWMQDITGADKPHFQWDGGRKFTGAMVRSGKLPPTMPPYKSDAGDSAILNAFLAKHTVLDRAYWENVFKTKASVPFDIIKALFSKIT